MPDTMHLAPHLAGDLRRLPGGNPSLRAALASGSGNRMCPYFPLGMYPEARLGSYPKPPRYLLHRALGALVPYTVGTGGVRVSHGMDSARRHNSAPTEDMVSGESFLPNLQHISPGRGDLRSEP